MTQSSYQHAYLESFKKLESLLRRYTNVSFDVTQFKNVVINKAKSKKPAVKYCENFIRGLYGFRNVFAHADIDNCIAEVNDVTYVKVDGIKVNTSQIYKTNGIKFWMV